jgi:hypothetical protein
LNSHLKNLVSLVVAVATFPLAFLMPGCTGITFQSGDALKSVYSARVAQLKTKYSSANLEGEIVKARTSGAARNELLNDFIFLIDSNYTFWEKHLYHKKAYADFGADVMATSLSTLSGIVSGAGVQGAKSILSFVAGGITSTRASFTSDILQSQNLLAIVAKMREQRSVKRITLQEGMYVKGGTRPRSVNVYSVDQGLIDLEAYYQAGTFVSALQEIIDKAAKDKADADKRIENNKNRSPLRRQLPIPPRFPLPRNSRNRPAEKITNDRHSECRFRPKSAPSCTSAAKILLPNCGCDVQPVTQKTRA